MQKRILCYAIACLFSLTALSQTTVTLIQDKPIWDLRLENATNMSASDDGTSQVFDFGFDFNFFGETFNQGYMASNGCLILGSLSTASTWEKNCTQYNPSPSPNTNYTIYPFWTDLIMGENSSMLAKSFDDKVIFGWYEMWEYYRDSKNTFELWLYPNDTYEARYGELDIQDHDVFIGIQGKEDEFETYYFHDECNTGVYNSKECYNYDWNSSDKNQNLENGGSLFVGEVIDCSNPLNDTSCAGYWDAYDDLQCDLDPQYGPFCPGYTQEMDIGYYQEEEYFDYGYEEEMFDFGYEEYDVFSEELEVFEEYIFEPEYELFEEPEFVFEEEIIFEEFQPIDDFIEPLPFILEEEVFIPIEDLMVEEFVFQETFIEEVEEWFEEETIVEEELAYAEEQEEEFIEELIEEEDEVIEDEVIEEEKSSISKETALKVVSSTITTAKKSVSGTNSGSSIHAQGGTSTASSINSSSGGISTSSSPSISDQFASSTAQNNQVLDMSATVSSSTGTQTDTVETTSVAVDTTSTQSIQSQIDISMPTNSTDTETEQLVEDVIAQNMQAAQEDVIAKQEETGEYGSEDLVISYIGFVPGFNTYRAVSIPEKEFWYEPKNIYTNNRLLDNTAAFYELAGQSITTLTNLKEMQPNL